MTVEWLYYGVPLDVFQGAFQARLDVRVKQARFWAFSTWPRAWIVAYPTNGSPPFPVLVDARMVRVSQYPADPPPMPAWARNGEVPHGA